MARKKVKPVPYAEATSGTRAREEIIKILMAFGCESVGFMDDFSDHSVVLAFKHRSRPVQLRASARGWAAMYLRARPWAYGKRETKDAYERRALDQGLIAVNSILRDWMKGQVAAVETGILSFEAVFFPYMLTNDGRPVIDAISAMGLLPPPKQ